MEERIQKLKKHIMYAKRADSFMLAALVVLALTIPLCIVKGNWLHAFCSCLWIYVGCRWYKKCEDSLDQSSADLELIAAQDRLLDKLTGLLLDSAKEQSGTEEEKKEE